MIEAFGLTSNPRKAHPPAVDDVTFEAHAGRVTALLGEAHAGKTTVLRLMLELQQGRGLTYFRGRPLHRIAHPAREIGVLLGDVPGHPSRSVRGHLRMLCAATGVPARRADEVLEAVGLVSLREERLGTLSRGMDRRLGLACALLPDPHTLVLDEPANGLPAREVHWLHRMLRAHAEQGGTVLFTTADPKEAVRAADRVVTLQGGRLVADQEATEFARTRLRPRVAVRSPHAARLADLLTKEARADHRSVEVVREGGNRLSVYGSTTAEVGDAAFRHGILVHQLADETGDMGPGAGTEPLADEEPETVRQQPDHGEPAPAAGARPAHERRLGESEDRSTEADADRPASSQGTVEEVPAAGRPEALRAERRQGAGAAPVTPQPRAESGWPRPTTAPTPADVTEPPHPASAAGLTGNPPPASQSSPQNAEPVTHARPAEPGPAPVRPSTAPAVGNPSAAPVPATPSAAIESPEPSGHATSTRTAAAVPAQPPAAASVQPVTAAVSAQSSARPAPAHPSAPAASPQPPTRASAAEASDAQSSPRAVPDEAPAPQPPIHSVAAENPAVERLTTEHPAVELPVTERPTAEAPAKQPQQQPQPKSQPRKPTTAPDGGPVPSLAGRVHRAEAAALDTMSPLPPPISVRSAPSPLRPLRYELRRAAGIGAGFLTCGAVLLVSALTAVLLARLGHTPQARLFAAWPRELPLPPAALGAGLLGALSFGDEFRHPALAADRGTVPRRLGLLTAKLLVSGATAVLLSFLTLGCDAEVLYLVYGRELAQVPGDWIPLTASWFGLVVGCAWAGVLAAGVFRSTTAGLAAVLAVPVVVVPVVHKALEGSSVRMAAGLPVRMRELFLLRWPFGGERYLVGAARVLAQPVGGALALSLTALLCAYVFTTLRTRLR
ncbi:ATP-binding cassette domain-containing protein [Streptomyces sp. NPDC007901]|uniref:ATP-binding cassette domain-containing protein n=1 Tax=Streptomyces sp. NPDC007901 TaxID=3364785 RepID=UPI0036E73CFB